MEIKNGETTVFDLVKEDSVLPDHIKANGKSKTASEFRNVLLTGATGHLGPYVLNELCMKKELTIFCLVRATSIEMAEERITAKLKQNGLLSSTNLSNVVFVLGNVAEEYLGMQKDIYNLLAKVIDAVIHIAVFSNHVKKYPVPKNEQTSKDLRAVNVIGTRHVLEFACIGKTKYILHGSSLSAVNRFKDDGTLSEELPEDDNFGDEMYMGYANSKLAAEKLVKRALVERGIPIMVLRFPMILGDSTTGYAAELDHFSMIALSCLISGLFPHRYIASPHMASDICAKVAIKLFFNDKAEMGVYNMTTPTVVGNHDIFDVAVKSGISGIKKASYEEYMKTILELKDCQPLAPFKKIYSKRFGVKELMHSHPYLKMAWHDPQKNAVVSKKLEKCLPEYRDMVQTNTKTAELLLNFFKTSGYSDLINHN